MKNEIFKHFVEAEIPPKLVFVSFDGEVRSLILAECADYNYTPAGFDYALDIPMVVKI